MRSNLKMDSTRVRPEAGAAGITSPSSNSTRLVGDVDDAAAADALTSGDVKFLPNPAAKHLREMLGVAPDQSSAIAGDFVGDPTAASHADFVRIIIQQLPVILSGARPLARERTCGVEEPGPSKVEGTL